MAELSSLSTEFVLVPVAYIDPVTGSQVDPTGDTVQIAFTTPTADPQSGDWLSASWHAGGPPYNAQVLVGPGAGGHPLTKGGYRVWIKIVSNPELPVLKAGFLKVT